MNLNLTYMLHFSLLFKYYIIHGNQPIYPSQSRFKQKKNMANRAWRKVSEICRCLPGKGWCLPRNKIPRNEKHYLGIKGWYMPLYKWHIPTFKGTPWDETFSMLSFLKI